MTRTRIGVFLMGLAALGQTPSFEVATVKSAPPPTDGRIMIGLGGDPGRVNYTNTNLKMILPRAFGVKSFQITGPSWLETERYNIVAKIPDNTPPEQVPLMLQNLLVERFKLKFHREKKDLPVYALVTGKNGPKLEKSEDNGLEGPPDAPGVKQAGTGRGPGGRGMMMFGPGRLEMKHMSISNFADMLSNILDRPVLDQTGIQGFYNIKLEVSMEELMQMKGAMTRIMPGGPGPGAGEPGRGPAPESAPGQSIFTAIQQLGLKLEPKKEPLEMIVIDSGDKVPPEN